MDQKLSANPSKKRKLNENPTSPLPEKVLSIIFDHLAPREKLQCLLVCESWNSVIQQPNLGLDMKYNFSGSPLTKTSEAYQVFMKSERPIYNLTILFQDLPDSAPMLAARKTATENLIKLLEKIGENVRVLSIKGPATNDLKPLECFPLLEKLSVADEEMIQLIQEIPENITHFHAEKISMYVKSSVDRFISYNLPNLKVITADEIDLSDTYVRPPNESFEEPSFTEYFSVSKDISDFYREFRDTNFFLKNHVNLMTIETLKIEDVFLKTESSLFYMFYFYKVSAIKEAEIFIHDRCWFSHGDCQMKNLESVQIKNVASTIANCKGCMKGLAESCPKLTKLHLTAKGLSVFAPLLKFGKGFEIHIFTDTPINPTKLFRVITPKLTTRFDILKVLVLGRVDYLSPEDWNGWPEMPNLEELRLQINLKSKDSDICWFQPGKLPNYSIGVETIAKKCRQIRIFEFLNYAHTLKCSQVKVFLEEWPFLKALHTSRGEYHHNCEMTENCFVKKTVKPGLIKMVDVFEIKLKLSRF